VTLWLDGKQYFYPAGQLHWADTAHARNWLTLLSKLQSGLLLEPVQGKRHLYHQ